jgi:hypothetical protein
MHNVLILYGIFLIYKYSYTEKCVNNLMKSE